MRRLGARLIAACEHGGVITLNGELGTGKTTLVRGALEA
ncbi:MAG: tRNA (adenosine(37)-N6)-threonylcarbamoyltransferase complex ATPase subunit type 1 TsaE, partial [Gammaproteobacteria bacterium]